MDNIFAKEKYPLYSRFCRFILTKIMGWEIATPPAQSKKCILIGVPHTSMWDFIVSYLFYKSWDMETHVMVKKSLFVGPVGAFLRGAGAIPVDQKDRSTMVRSVISEMDKEDIFHLAIAVEGTRRPVARWQRGYHIIASAVGCPVYLCYFDWGTKRVGVGDVFTLTDDSKADTIRLQQTYEDMHLVGKHPQKYITH